MLLFRLAAQWLLVVVAFLAMAGTSTAGFIYSPISGSITGAMFNADFAGLTAHRYFDGIPVNEVVLFDPFAHVAPVDLSEQLFGTSEFLAGDTPSIDLGSDQTRVYSIPIPDAFFPALATGRVGLSFLFSDTGDGMFAMDFLSLDITSTDGIYRAIINSNDGYGKGLADNGNLSGPVFDILPPDSTGTGFDETISSKSDYNNPIPEPGTALLAGAGAFLLSFVRRRNKRHD